jgi:hypothetical protein
MTALPITKLTKAGESLTLNVMACAKVPVGQYPEVEFSGIDIESRTATAVRVPESSANRQLARLNLTYADCVGKTLRFSRDPNASQPSKPYWGISVTQDSVPKNSIPREPDTDGAMLAFRGGDEPPPPDDHDHPEAPPPARAPLSNGKLAASFNLYDECFGHALKLTSEAAAQNFKVDTAAIAATLFIQANR